MTRGAIETGNLRAERIEARRMCAAAMEGTSWTFATPAQRQSAPAFAVDVASGYRSSVVCLSSELWRRDVQDADQRLKTGEPDSTGSTLRHASGSQTHWLRATVATKREGSTTSLKLGIIPHRLPHGHRHDSSS